METGLSTITIPVIPYFCNVVVFPLPPGADYDNSPVFILKKTAEIQAASDHDFTFDYLSSHVYCLLPSDDMHHGTVSLYQSRPAFLDTFSYCLQIDPRATPIRRRCTVNDGLPVPKSVKGLITTCKGCFVSHFPRPNQRLCKWNKSKKEGSKPSLQIRIKDKYGKA